MKYSTLPFLAAFALSSSAFGQSAADLVSGPIESSGVFQASEHGAFSGLTLATTEVCYLDAGGKLQIAPVAASSPAAVMSLASVPGEEKYLVFYPKGQEQNPKERRILRNRYLVKLAPNADLETVKARCGMKSLEVFDARSGLAVCEGDSAGQVLRQLGSVSNDPDILSAEPLFARQRYPRLIPNDPFYDTADNPRDDEVYQWYLNNEGVQGAVANVDINVEAAYDRATGEGVTVAVIDDGLATDHTDLAPNAVGPHLNLRDGDPDDPATLDATLNHGTNVAGLIAAAFQNGEGIAGAAPNAELSGIRLLGAPVDDAEEALSFSFSNDVIDIYNAGFGPDDESLDLEGPGPLAAQALESAALDGRPLDPNDDDSERLGNVFVWPAGNGGEIGDDSNADGYANSRYTIAVGAVADNGTRAPYSERGSNLVVVAPSSGGALDMLTTSYSIGVDEDDNPIRVPEYDPTFGGTSASAALVSGVVALMLEENSELNWREVQDILIRTASRVDEGDGEWITNAAGYHFNQNYGAGLVNAQAAVAEAFAARDGESALGPVTQQIKSRFYLSDVDPNSPDSGRVPDNNGESFLAEFDMTQDEAGNPLPNLRVEHVQVSATIVTERRSELEIVLISPNGTQSVLQEVNVDNDEQSIVRWAFNSVRNWGEGSAGSWVVRITDLVTGNAANVNNLSLVISGSEDPDAPVSQIPILTSTRFLSVLQNSAFTYRLEASGASSVEVGDLPPGVSYNPNTQIISGVPNDPGLYFVPVVLRNDDGDDGEFRITIVVRPTAVALGDAVGLPDRPAIFDGDLPWDFELTDTNDPDDALEPRAARSAINLGDNERSIFGFDNLPQGYLAFDWKTSSEEGADRLWFNRGGQIPQRWDAFISGEQQWGRIVVPLPDRSNDVRWIYSKNATESEGEDRGLVDNVVLFTREKYREEIIRAGNIEGFDFEFDGRTGFVVSTLAGSPPPGGGAPSSLVTPAIGNGQSSSMSGWVEGPGVFSCIITNFSEPNDVVELIVDGASVRTFRGLAPGERPNPTTVNYPVVEGRHRLQLRYRRDFSGSADPGAFIPGSFFDDIKYIPDDNFQKFVSEYGSGLTLTPEGDFDQDGYSNHMEYAFGGNLAVADVPQYLPQLVENGGSNYIEFGIDRSRDDLVYLAQQSSDLENWVEAELATLERTEGEVEIYRIPVASGPGRRDLFYRVIARAK